MRSGIWRFTLNACRFYRRYPGRKRVQVEAKIKSPKRYDELRGANPAILLQGNLFTPESAGPRELSMLCFKMVNLGYADSSILLRYVQCTLQMLPKLRIKHIALVMQSVSKYVAMNPAVLAAPSDTDDTSFETELANREKLLLKVKELVEAVTPNMFKLFARAAPKDLGMVALSMVTICECALKELDIAQSSDLLKATEHTLKQIAESIGPKLPFCELQEYAALAKAFCRLPPHVEYADMFLRDLATEISCLLNEKNEQLTDLVNGIYIGDDLVEDLQSLPKELTTIACTISKRVKHHNIWQRMVKSVELMLALGTRDSELFCTLDGQTLVLLATALSRHADVSFILEAMLESESSLKPPWIVTAIALSLRSLADVSLAQRMWDALDFSQVAGLDDAAKTQLVYASTKIPKVTDDQINALRSFNDKDSSPELLVALYVARHRCRLEADNGLIDSVIYSVDKIGAGSLITLLRSAGERYDLTNLLLKTLNDKLDEVHIDKLYPLVIYIIDNHGGCTEMIKSMVSRIAAATPSHQYHSLVFLVNKLREIGFDPSSVLHKDLILLIQNAVEGDDGAEVLDHFVETGKDDKPNNELELCERDEDEIAELFRANKVHGVMHVGHDEVCSIA